MKTYFEFSLSSDVRDEKEKWVSALPPENADLTELLSNLADLKKSGNLIYDNEAPQTGIFKNDWIILWIITP